VHAEWTKFRTVRGWVVAICVAALLTVGTQFLNHSSATPDWLDRELH